MTRELNNKKEPEMRRPGTAFQREHLLPIGGNELNKLAENQ